MKELMTRYDQLVPGKDQSDYYWFAIKATFKCDECDQVHEREQTYFLLECYCPNPDCTCRSVAVVLCRLDGTTAVSIADAMVNLDGFQLSADTWKHVELKADGDRHALTSVTRRLNSNPALLEQLNCHWREVRDSVVRRHKHERKKQRARRLVLRKSP